MKSRSAAIDAPLINPAIVLAGAVMAVSTGAIFARMADAPAVVIAAYRVGIAVVLLMPFAVFTAGDELLHLSAKDLRLSCMAGFFLALHFATWISSLDYTAVANSVVLVNTNPLWVAVAAPFVTGDRIKRATFIGIVISIAGAAFIGAGDFVSGGAALKGDLLALAGSICMAVYLLLGRNLRRRLSLTAYITVCYASAAAFLWLFVWILRQPVSGFDAGTWTLFGAMALITHLVGHSSYNWALRWLSPSLIAVSLLGEPIGGTLLAYLFFGEGPGGTVLLGGFFILAAIYIVGRAECDARRPPETACGGC